MHIEICKVSLGRILLYYVPAHLSSINYINYEYSPWALCRALSDCRTPMAPWGSHLGTEGWIDLPGAQSSAR